MQKKNPLTPLFFLTSFFLPSFFSVTRQHRASIGGEGVPRYVAQPVGFLAVQGSYWL